jgi:predicted HTH domain antitoxin
MTIEIPDSVFSSSPTYLPNDLKLDMAVWLYDRKKLSLIRAARLANLDIISFNRILSEKGIVVNYTENDFETDVQSLKKVFGTS